MNALILHLRVWAVPAIFRVEDEGRTMASQITDRLRAQTRHYANCGEIRMFGGICFTLNGNMHCGTMKDGDVLFRVGPDQETQALALPGTRLMEQAGRTMKGFIIVSADHLGEEQALNDWVALAANFVENASAEEKIAP
jgi:TfoX/Sxy family transcriptional regulator of competence genes